jgi:hypothetical protein
MKREKERREIHTALVAPLPFLGTVFGPDVPRSLEFLKKQSMHATRSSQIVSALAFACNSAMLSSLRNCTCPTQFHMMNDGLGEYHLYI